MRKPGLHNTCGKLPQVVCDSGLWTLQEWHAVQHASLYALHNCRAAWLLLQLLNTRTDQLQVLPAVLPAHNSHCCLYTLTRHSVGLCAVDLSSRCHCKSPLTADSSWLQAQNTHKHIHTPAITLATQPASAVLWFAHSRAHSTAQRSAARVCPSSCAAQLTKDPHRGLCC